MTSAKEPPMRISSPGPARMISSPAVLVVNCLDIDRYTVFIKFDITVVTQDDVIAVFSLIQSSPVPPITISVVMSSAGYRLDQDRHTRRQFDVAVVAEDYVVAVAGSDGIVTGAADDYVMAAAGGDVVHTSMLRRYRLDEDRHTADSSM
jgi:hypothetical protein